MYVLRRIVMLEDIPLFSIQTSSHYWTTYMKHENVTMFSPWFRAWNCLFEHL